MERSIWASKTMQRRTWTSKTIVRTTRMPKSMERSTWYQKLWSERSRHREIRMDWPGHWYLSTPYHERLIRRSVANGTPISTLLEVLDFSKILDKNFWSRVKLECCCQDSILCTSGYMEISGIFRMDYRVYEFSDLSYPIKLCLRFIFSK